MRNSKEIEITTRKITRMSGRMSKGGRGYDRGFGRGQSGRGRGRGSRPYSNIFGQRNYSNLKGACEELSYMVESSEKWVDPV